jgi:hypothetical protein
MRRKLVLWFLLLLTGFLIGFILQYSRLQRVQKEVSTSTGQLRSCQSRQPLAQLRDTTTMMYLEVVQNNGAARVTELNYDDVEEAHFGGPRKGTSWVGRGRCPVRFVTDWQGESK